MFSPSVGKDMESCFVAFLAVDMCRVLLLPSVGSADYENASGGPMYINASYIDVSIQQAACYKHTHSYPIHINLFYMLVKKLVAKIFVKLDQLAKHLAGSCVTVCLYHLYLSRASRRRTNLSPHRALCRTLLLTSGRWCGSDNQVQLST